MMNFKRFFLILIGAGLVVPILTYSQAEQAIGKNIEAMLTQILENQKQMQADIMELKIKLAEKDDEIAELKKAVSQQQAAVEKQAQAIVEQKMAVQEQAKAIEEQKTAPAAGGTDYYSARVQYEVARQLMHDTIFNVRKGEQGPWFERTIVELRKVVENHPAAPEAPEAQIRIARIYRRYLDDVQNAKKEYQTFLQMFPDHPKAREAQNSLQELN